MQLGRSSLTGRPWPKALSLPPLQLILLALTLSVLLFLFLEAPWLRPTANCTTSPPPSASPPLPSRSGSSCSRETRVSQRSTSDGACWARQERDCFSPPPEGLEVAGGHVVLQERLRQFEERMKQCTASVNNWTALIRGETAPPDATCQYVIFKPQSSGLGNRVESVVSAFLYALLTDRALLVFDSGFLRLLCDPFPHGTWHLPDSAEEEMRRVAQDGPFLDNLMAKAGEVEKVEDEEEEEVKENKKAKEKKEISVFLDLAFMYTHSSQNFFCDKVQEVLSSVQVLIMLSDQFFVPGLCLISSFQQEFDQLFPDRAPFFHLAHYLINPNNYVWERISRLYENNMMHADRRVGLQMRASADHNVSTGYARYCLVNVSTVLPHPIPSDKWNNLWSGYRSGHPQFKWRDEDRDVLDKVVKNTNAEKVALLVTSLHPHHITEFKEFYDGGVAVDGTVVNVLSFSTALVEIHLLEADEQALTEIFLLSFCDALFTTFFSTFGYVAAGLQGRPPYLVDIYATVGKRNAHGKPACARVESGEPCYHFPPHDRKCAAEVTGENELTPVLEPDPSYLMSCRDTSRGIGRRMWNPSLHGDNL